MSVIQGILLGILQGVAEFLPISSSGHLDVAKNLFGLGDVPILFDVLLHLATLAAVCLYFRRKIWELLKTLARWIAQKQADENEKQNRRMIIAIIISTAVTGVIGIATSKLIPNLSVKYVCAGFVITAILLIFSAMIEKRNESKVKPAGNSKSPVSAIQALFIGFMQGVGTLPGISRSGSTIAGALFAGVDRKVAGEYSFIISIPAILGAFILEVKDLEKVSQTIGAFPIVAGCAAAFAAGYISLTLLMKIIQKGKLQWFAAYLIPAGIIGMIFLR
jgi:undecaprenyl-diphosphatase